VIGGLGALLAWFVGSVLRVRRRHVEASLARAGIADPAGVAARMYRSLGRGIFELCALGLVPRRMLSRVELPELDERFARGAIVLTAHTGNWDLAACAVASRRPLTVVTKHFRIRWLDRLWQGLRAARGVRLVGEGDAAATVLEAVRAGGLAALLIDQAPRRARSTVMTSFLGARAAVDLAPALLAQRARVPAVVAFPFRDARGAHRVEVACVLEPPARASRAWAEDAMRQATARLEHFVRRHPEQWLWMHRRWRLPDGDPRAPALRGKALPGFEAGGIRAG
jgi:KDO2-lipid IV(A) lauroyltransferase